LTVAGAKVSSWALLDRTTGTITGTTNRATFHNTIESMIKPFIAGDYLRRLAEQGKTPSDTVMNELTLMIVDSNDPMAEKYYQLGGADAVVQRFISICGLSDVKLVTEKWSFTELSAQTAIAYATCIADGRAAGPTWTDWLLTTMQHIRGTVDQQVSGAVEGGRWGIIDALPPDVVAQTSIKNGWTSYVDGWHVNCMAINPNWILVIMMRRSGNLAPAAAGCTAITKGLLPTAP
jgi:hypothetical protein